MDFHDDFEALNTIPDEVGQDIHERMAAMAVRRMCLQHACTAAETGVCTHPNHRRDADYLLSTDARYPGMLDMLGLDHEHRPYTDDEARTWLTWIGQSGPIEDAA